MKLLLNLLVFVRLVMYLFFFWSKLIRSLSKIVVKSWFLWCNDGKGMWYCIKLIIKVVCIKIWFCRCNKFNKFIIILLKWCCNYIKIFIELVLEVLFFFILWMYGLWYLYEFLMVYVV